MAIEIKGNWTKGFALDLHTLSSKVIGEDERGEPIFETIRSEIGELVYKLKYKQDSSVIKILIDKISKTLRNINKFDCFIAVPPTIKDRKFQPVFLLGESLAKKFSIPFLKDALVNNNKEQLKNIKDISKRQRLLLEGIKLTGKHDLQNKRILLIDDLYRSGSTLTIVTDILMKQAKAKDVCVLTLTKTRVNI